MAYQQDDSITENPAQSNRLQQIIDDISKSLKVSTKTIKEGKEEFQIIKTHDGKTLKIPLTLAPKSRTSGSMNTK